MRLRYYGRYIIFEDGNIANIRTGKMLSPITDKEGYKKVTIYISKDRSETAYIHRLIAEAFVAKPDSEKKLVVYHKDGNKANNAASNLEWREFDELIKDHHKNNVYRDHLDSMKKKVFMINPEDNFSSVEFDSLIEAAIYLKSIKPELPDVLSIRSNISAAYDNTRSNRAYGYIWKSSKE